MRIAINLLYVRQGEIGGSEILIYNLVKQLLKNDKENNYILLVTPNNKNIFTYEDIPVKYLEFDFGNYTQIKRIFHEQFILPIKIKKEKIDLLVNMGNTGLIYCPCKLMLTVYDLLYLACPGEYSFIKRLYLRVFVWLSCKQADKIAVISENTKRDIVNYLHVKKDKITVVYAGVDFEKFALTDRNESSEFMRKEYNIRDPYIYSPTSLFPRKNIKLLIESFVRLKKNKNIPHKLVITGVDPHKRRKLLEKSIEAIGMKQEIFYLGRIPDKHIPYLYKAADLMAYLSSYEGFGLPLIEAMAADCPVISADKASLPEALGDAGIMVDPFNIEEVADKMYKLLMDNELRNKLIKKGSVRSKSFSWEKVAKTYINSFKEM